jgi:hypothetical protein
MLNNGVPGSKRRYRISRSKDEHNRKKKKHKSNTGNTLFFLF